MRLKIKNSLWQVLATIRWVTTADASDSLIKPDNQTVFLKIMRKPSKNRRLLTIVLLKLKQKIVLFY